MKKNSVKFWHWQLTLKVRFCHLLTNWRILIHQWIFLKHFPLSMLILGQKSCFLGPTILKFHNRTDQNVTNGVDSQLAILSQYMISYKSGIILKDWHKINKIEIATKRIPSLCSCLCFSKALNWSSDTSCKTEWMIQIESKAFKIVTR